MAKENLWKMGKILTNLSLSKGISFRIIINLFDQWCWMGVKFGHKVTSWAKARSSRDVDYKKNGEGDMVSKKDKWQDIEDGWCGYGTTLCPLLTTVIALPSTVITIVRRHILKGKE
jgi:hypothetical protein